MLAEKIGNINKALGTLAHRVDSETWAVIRLAREELMDAYDLAREIENTLTIPGGKDGKKKTKESVSN